MSTIAAIELNADEFALGQSLPSLTNGEVEVIRVAATDEQTVVPYVRVSADDFDAFHDALDEDTTVQSWRLVDDLGEERLYRMEWVKDILVVVHLLLEEEGAVLEMHGHQDCWRLRILLPDRDSLTQTAQFCEEEGITFVIKHIYELDGSVGRGQYGLSRDQYEVLTTAIEQGYFDVPRSVTMGDLAETLDISQQAVSERLRRGHKNLLESTLEVGESSFGEPTKKQLE
ncbi:helix-turn-helix domain-containing protein [Halogeometricum limi]|uniref:GAF and HTH_10 associated domain-containing protein n=1 Tax=Halogeometricum limi TaxID=555875 RepID=A0A1I6FQ31_9EURY|nr:helix-turn-helix domain-containing protein [Halogeometricum limi]SFR31897.1 hypothetical protein SAMN04488124_0019 [Halogeometricum limi]